VRTDFDTGRDLLVSLLVQLDGKIVAAGTAAIGFSSDFALARYKADGSLDQSFGTNNGVTVAGEVTTNFPAGHGFVHDIALQPDGKIVAAGEIGVLSSTIIPSSDIALARYQPAGTLDPSFGGGGTRDIDFGPGSPGIGTNEAVEAVALQPDGKIVTAGARSDTGDSAASFMVNRFNPDGSFDPSFGSGGVVTTSLRESDAAFDLALQADGRIVAVGFSEITAPPFLNFGVARYLTDSAVTRIAALEQSVDASTLPEGLRRSLQVKLHSGCTGLNAFANEVRAQSDKRIPTSTASGWLAETASIRLALGCG
jgi:uncharacterized delta-60 repeat protein